MSTYTLTFFDGVGQKISGGVVDCPGDVRAVVSAIHALKGRLDCDAVEVAKGDAVLRRVSRSEIGSSGAAN